ncbi:MAG: haloacid dehalogenase-like hydrolase, partial [Gemmatimonadota bacterium]|nr:haloacid dehalogenase-like hydrolase [Gemmatimonadota bacterium]
MATLIFDFDSTLVRCETLEELVADQLAGDPSRAERYRAMTEAGMSGGWTFTESLTARLSVAAPGLADIESFTHRLDELWTDGMPDLVRKLHERGHEVWIVSGAPLEVISAAGVRLGVPQTRVRGVRLVWD